MVKSKKKSLGILKILFFAALLTGVSAMGFAIWSVETPKKKTETTKSDFYKQFASRALKDGNGELKVLSWNIHFGAGPADDRGRKLSKAEVLKNLDAIAETIEKLSPDIVLLQEVDFQSDRTRGINQLEYLNAKLKYPFAASALTWSVKYLPYPFWPLKAQYGRMKSGQAILSRHQLSGQTLLRHNKPSANPFWYNYFYLRRTSQKVAVIGAGFSLVLINTHLEAFDQKNREENAAELNEIIIDAQRGGSAVIAGGDFNAIPKEASLRKAFADEPQTDMTTDKTIEIVCKNTSLFDALSAYINKKDGAETFSFPADAPNRRLDYILATDDFKAVDAKFISQAAHSDHLPLFVVLKYNKIVKQLPDETNKEGK